MAVCGAPIALIKTMQMRKMWALKSDWSKKLRIFPVLILPLLGSSESALAACEPDLISKVCWVNSSDLALSKANPDYKRACLSGGAERFGEKVLSICRQLPPLFQEILSAVDTVHIESGLNSVAYAAGTAGRSIVGIQQEVLENETSFESLFSWKEQLIFRKNTPRFRFDEKLPHYRLVGSALPNAGLLYVLIHEFAHLLDYRNNVNVSWAAAEWEGPRYRPTSGTKSMKSYLGSISFYGSSSAIYPMFAKSMYDSLSESTFISAYASTDSFEDFAEMVAHYIFVTYYGQNIQLVFESRDLLDAKLRLETDAFGAKFDFVERFLMRTDLKIRP